VSRATQRRAIVIGGSMSGLLAALLLRARGWDVDIYERVEGELNGRGAGIVAQPDLIARLAALGLDVAGLGYDVSLRKLFDRSGRLTHTHPCPQTMTAWERVHRLLHAAFDRGGAQRYHRGRWLKAFEQDAVAVTAHFNDGSKVQADLVVGADGLRSTVRRHCDSDVAPRYAGYVAWRALIGADAVPATVREALFNSMSFCLPPGELFLGYPVAGPDGTPTVSDERYNIVWYRPVDEATELPRLLTDRYGVAHMISIPPPLIADDMIAAMCADAERLLCPQFQAIVPWMHQPILQPIYDLESRHMAFGRVAIIGDAAFVARPHVAAGLVKAADDAQALVTALDAEPHVASALERFEAERLPVDRRIVERARHLGAFLQATRTPEESMHAERHSRPEAVLAETALLDVARG
jgi:2-polyprenyl-6-methoxyphenol hydroxylase-like FAD-dependent oxidoreductase